MSRKPLVLWAARKHWTLRFSGRTSTAVTGIFTTVDGPVSFRYDQESQRIHLPDETILVNEYGWEVDEQGRTVFRSASPHSSTTKTNTSTEVTDEETKERPND